MTHQYMSKVFHGPHKNPSGPLLMYGHYTPVPREYDLLIETESVPTLYF